MGCSCDKNIEEVLYNQSNISEKKSIFQNEYFSYLNFIYELKGYLNINQFSNNISGINIINNENENRNDNNKNQEFYLIPAIWFENWEKWIKDIIIKNEYKKFNTNFKYKNYKNKAKFYYHLINEENWKKISINKLYDFSEGLKTKEALICNNLMIFQYNSEKKHAIEIFFFEKDDDLFLTNLLFSFKKCTDAESEFNSLFELLKSSPIKEILGNMHYEQSELEFLETKKKILIYNKTREVNNDIKIFRKKQYQLFLDTLYKKEIEDIQSDKVKLDKKKEDYIERNNTINNNNKKKLDYIIRNDESLPISRASTIMNPNQKYLMSNSKVLPINSKEFFMDNIIDEDEKNSEKNKLSLNNKLGINSKKINNIKIIETTEIIEFQINENLLLSCFFCFFNIEYLREFIHKNIEVKVDTNNLYNNFSYIMNYLYDNLYTSENKIDINKLNNMNFKLIKNYPEYNYEILLEIIKNGEGKNIISKILNLLHLNLNLKISNKVIKGENNFKNNKESPEFNKFINDIKKSNDSIIFDLFFSIKKTKKICNNCNYEINKYKIINTFNISMDLILKNNNSKNLNRKNTMKDDCISIEECINYSLKPDNRENSIFNCSSCKTKANFTKIKEISKFSEIVILYFYYNKNKENIKIDFFKNLNLLDNIYILIGIISMDINNEENNYFSYCKEIWSNNWYKIDDDNINNIDMTKEKELIKYPLVLFYQKRK